MMMMMMTMTNTTTVVVKNFKHVLTLCNLYNCRCNSFVQMVAATIQLPSTKIFQHQVSRMLIMLISSKCRCLLLVNTRFNTLC